MGVMKVEGEKLADFMSHHDHVGSAQLLRFQSLCKLGTEKLAHEWNS
jgi:hypothetical protein